MVVDRAFGGPPARSLRVRLESVLPELRGRRYSISSADLPSAAFYVQFVRRHDIAFEDGAPSLRVVEKSLRRGPFGPPASFETEAYRRLERHRPIEAFRVPRFLGGVRTPCLDIVFIAHVEGRRPNLVKVLAQAARGIAELEARSAALIEGAPPEEARRLARMDFFAGAITMPFRHAPDRNLEALRALVRRHGELAPLAGRIDAMREGMAGLRERARAGRPCFSHLDLLGKNFLLTEAEELYLIDWGEFRVGRVGFDAGFYLSTLMRGQDLARFHVNRRAFQQHYRAALPENAGDEEAMKAARDFIFLSLSLFHLVRPKTLTFHRERKKYDQWIAKIELCADMIAHCRDPSTGPHPLDDPEPA